MKWLKIIPVCLMFLGAFSCLAEDMSDCFECPTCPPEPPGPGPSGKGNVELTFSYLGDTYQPEMFGEMIDRVTVMVYDNGTSSRVAHQVIDKADLRKFQGTKLELKPGEYRIVCWGNCFETTELAACETYYYGRVHHPNHPLGKEIPTNCHLYHGILDVTVPEKGKAEGDVRFSGAHINMEIYTRGAHSAQHPHLMPYLRVHKLMPQYNLDMQPAQPAETTYYPQTKYNMALEAFESRFQVLRFGDANPVEIEVRNTPDSSVHTFSLQDHMAENNITVDGKNEATVRILIEFNDLGVKIGMPDWNPDEVTPE